LNWLIIAGKTDKVAMAIKKTSTINQFLIYLSGPIISAFIGFLSVPITTRLIDPSRFGQASMYLTVTNIITMFVFLGLDQSYARQYNEYERKDVLMNTAMFPALGISLVLGMVLMLFAKQFSVLIYGEMSWLSMGALALSFPLAVLQRYYLLFMRMAEKPLIFNITEIGSKLISIFLTLFLLIKVEASFSMVVIAQFSMDFFKTLIGFFFTRSHVPMNFRMDFSLYKPMLKFGAPLILSGVLVWILNSMDKIAIRKWSTFTDLGLYSSAFKVVAVLTIVRRAFMNTWTPMAYKMFTEKDPSEKFAKISNIIFTGMVILYAILIAGRRLVIQILDPQYHDAMKYLPFLMTVPVIYIAAEVTGIGVNFSKKTWYNVLICGVAAVVNLLGNALLVPVWGGVGASLTTAVAYGVFFWMKSIIGTKLMGNHSLIRHLITFVLFFGMAFACTFINNLWMDLILLTVILVVHIPEISSMIRYLINYLKDIKGKLSGKISP
jgi:O-antigen/teichoic acid export membrane protein